jgi:methyltransferase
MILTFVILLCVTLQRLGELALARRNTARLLAQGGKEVGAGHYPLIVLLHGAWLLGLWMLAWGRPVDLLFLAIFVALQGLRVWVIASLGPRWTTRIIVLPGAPLVRRGPYRFVSHPNYLVVTAEIVVLPLAFQRPVFAAIFFVLNALVLAVRIPAESRALAAADPSLSDPAASPPASTSSRP